MALRDSLSIMVVDDMSTSRSLIIMALEEMGIKKVDFAKDGTSALQALAARPVHLVISDYNMPGMDGLQLLQALRSNRSRAHFPTCLSAVTIVVVCAEEHARTHREA